MDGNLSLGFYVIPLYTMQPSALSLKIFGQWIRLEALVVQAHVICTKRWLAHNFWLEVLAAEKMRNEYTSEIVSYITEQQDVNLSQIATQLWGWRFTAEWK